VQHDSEANDSELLLHDAYIEEELLFKEG
jgi:hypothetical protein